jgi:hypothetical protein
MNETGLVLKMAGSHPGRVALAGHWHGNLWWAERALPTVHEVGARVVVQLGDFGYWRGGDPATRKYLFRLNRWQGARLTPLGGTLPAPCLQGTEMGAGTYAWVTLARCAGFRPSPCGLGHRRSG